MWTIKECCKQLNKLDEMTSFVHRVIVTIFNPVYDTAKETLMYRTVFWTLWERERVGRFGRMALKHV